MKPRHCGCGRDMGPKQLWCTPCRNSLRRWIRMTDSQRRASYGRAEQRWMRVRTFRFNRQRRAA